MTNNEDSTLAVLKYDLGKLMPLRIILKIADGKWQGLTEESFSMDWSDSRVRVWWSGKAYSILGEHDINGINDADYNAKPDDLVIDPLSEDCPVEIDWASWRNAKTKYYQRNAAFKVKEKHDLSVSSV